jgi:hypothetical protein
VTINDAEFLDCEIVSPKRLVNFQDWCGAVIKGCRFTGRFVGNDFGHWPEQASNGSIENCDFSAAVLDGCRFVGCDINTIELPKWPCFAVLYPHNLLREVGTVEWPGKLGIWEGVLAKQPEITVALVEHAPSLAKEFNVRESDVRSILFRLGNVRM